MKRLHMSVTIAMTVTVLFAATAQAHFAWLVIDDQDRACYFFGESPADRTYHMPEALSEAEVVHTNAGETAELPLKLIDEDEFVGLRSAAQVEHDGQLSSTAIYGLYQGVLLNYHTQHLASVDAAAWPQDASGDATFQALLSRTDDGIQVKVLWDGKPLAGEDVAIYCEDGHKEGVATTNSAGIATFDAAMIEPGLNGLLVNYTDKQASGDWQGKQYTSATHILTATFVNGAAMSDDVDAAQ